MTLVEFIGFLITMFVLIFLFMKRTYEDVKRKRDPEKYARKQAEKEEALKEWLRSMNIPIKEEEVAEPEPLEVQQPISPPQPQTIATKPHRVVGDQFEFRTTIEDRHPTSDIEERELRTKVDKRYAIPYARRVASVDMRSHIPDAYAKKARLAPRGKELIKQQRSLRDLIIFQSVIGPPKSME